MDELAKLRWQCRRGSRELDLLLNRYLDTRYPLADEEEKARFVELLKRDDSQLNPAYLQVYLGPVASGSDHVSYRPL
jgi:antitoxin CptB